MINIIEIVWEGLEGTFFIINQMRRDNEFMAGGGVGVDRSGAFYQCCCVPWETMMRRCEGEWISRYILGTINYINCRVNTKYKKNKRKLKL